MLQCTNSRDVREANAEMKLALIRGADVVGRTTLHGTGTSSDSNTFVPSGAVHFIDLPAAGTHTYQLRVNVLSGDDGYVIHSRLVAYEL